MEDLKPKATVPEKFRRWYQMDREHSAAWRKEAKEDFDFVANRQWSKEEESLLTEQLRPVITFNYIGAYMDAVHGHEIGNRTETRYIPREMGDVKPNEILTAAAQWFNDESDGPSVESELFLDAAICGMGWSEDRIDQEENPQGNPYSSRVDPMEMVWDCNARKNNLEDRRRQWRVRQVPLDDAKEMFPGFTDSELDAKWASMDGLFSEPSLNDGFINLDGGNSADNGDRDTVTLVHCQYKVRQKFYKAVNPFTGEEVELTEAQKTLLEKQGIETYAQAFHRKVVKQAFLGEVVLMYGDGPSPTQFSFNCLTAKKDRVKGTFYGAVRAMKDPQRWSNKWLSQTLHILNSNAKGGIMAERDAFEDAREAEDSYARTDRITWMEDGALSGQHGPKVIPKPAVQFPAGFDRLSDKAEEAIRKVSNISPEMIGMADRDQSGVLEYQRRQSGMTALQPLFDQLRQYRKVKGKLILHYIQTYLSDNRLIRIVGNDKEQYVPLVRQAATEHDIIIDDAPSAPNQKEAAWAAIQGILPSIQQMLTPEVMLKLAKYSPIPTSVIEDLRELAKQGEQQGAEQQQQAQQMQMAAIQADLAKTQSEAAENQVDAQQGMVEAELTKAKILREQVETARMAAAPPEPQQFVGP